MYGLQHGALAHTEQQAIRAPKITSVKPFKQENQRSSLLSPYQNKKIKRHIYNLLYKELFLCLFFSQIHKICLSTNMNGEKQV